MVDECDVVLAEGSRGMVKEIMQIHKNFSKEVQHIMVSATFTPRIIQICNELCHELVEVFVDDGLLDLSGLVQFFEVLPE